MMLRTKALVIIAITILFLIIPFYAVVRIVLLGKFRKLETHSCQNNVERTLNMISYDLDSLNTIANTLTDWGSISNFGTQSFAELGINVVLFTDSSGRIIYGKAVDFEGNKEAPVPTDLLRHISTNDILLSHSVKGNSTGIILLSGGPMLIVSRPVTATRGEGPISGTLILGRFLDSKEISKLTEITPYAIAITRLNDAQLPLNVKEALLSMTPKPPIVIQPLDSKSIESYALIKDIYGKPALVLTMDMPRDVYRQGQATLYYFLLSLILFSSVLTGMIIFFLKRAVLSPLSNLCSNVEQVSTHSDLSARIPVVGRDEISNLTSSINGMLAALEQSHNELRESEERYRHLVELSPDVVIVHRDLNIIYINPAGVRLLGGSTASEFIGKQVVNLIHKDFRESFWQYIGTINDGKERGTLNCGKFVRPDGTVLDVEVAAASVIYDGKPAIQVVVRNITGRKQIEDKLRYLSMHDVLTGQYNRAYFEETICRFEDKRNYPVSIVVCDVDGLKFVNDTFGHSAGDALLKVAGKIIKDSFRETDVVTRIGGDEFAVLLPKCPHKAAQTACYKLMDSINKYNVENPQLPLHISKGIATCNKTTVKLYSVFQKADNSMYREKLLHRQSNFNAITQTLTKALEERDFITEGHVERLQELVARMAQALNMPEGEMSNLRLLAQFHDIGKVGIPDRILFKPGKLTSDETAEMQKHCEIGHRIAQSSPDLMPISDCILKHHEAWNGMGYPLGLKGEEISLECRILAIADAYDAMTNDRPYRKALIQEEAIAELTRNSGTQFDPALVSIFIQIIKSEERGELDR